MAYKPHGDKKTPPGAFDRLAAHTEWICRRAARELGVSVGVVHRCERSSPESPEMLKSSG
jgi:hypothetical protein